MISIRPVAIALLCAALWAAPARAQDSAEAQGNTPVTGPVDPLAVGNKLYEKGDFAGAAEAYRKVALTSKNPVNRAFAWFNLGNCHFQTKALNKAVVAYRRSIEEAPLFSRAWLTLGEVYFQLGAIGEAVPCYKRVIEIDGPSLVAYQRLGECALQAGDGAEALRNYDAALKIDPNQADIYLAEAEVNARVRDFAAAEKTVEEALLLLPSPPAEAYFYLGQLYELDGNDRKAVRAYEEGLLIDPKRTDYYMRVAGIHEKDGDEFLSLLTLEQAERAGIKRPEIYLKRGQIFFNQKRYDRALEEFKAAYALGSAQGKSGIENVAAAYFNAGDKKKAAEVAKDLE